MTNDQLAQALQQKNLLAEEVLEKVKREAFFSTRPLETLINEQRLVSDVAVAQLKSELLRIPYRKIDLESYNAALLEQIPEETARNYGVIPISATEEELIAGMLNPDDLKAQDALKYIARQHHQTLGVFLISFSDWQSILQKYSPFKGEIETAIRNLNLKAEQNVRKIVELEGGSGDPNEEAPIIRIVASSIREAIQSKASDIHIEPQEHTVRIRFRVDGDLHEAAVLPGELAAPIISRVKILSNLKIDETRVPQDGRFRSRVFNREVDFRVATFPTPLGEKVAIRILDPTSGLKSFDKLGLIGPNYTTVKEGIEKPYGMVLVTGPTGSGKSTTLYALLQMLNKEDVNIVSLEDPVEYFVPGINQSQVRPEIGYDFASGLRQILRQDPDIIMVGEIRDTETASLAINAALTGHIVLSTLHTNNAAGVIPRLIDMKVEPFLIPAAVNLMIAQRLLSVLCQNCKTPAEAAPEVQKLITQILSEVPKELTKQYVPPYITYHSPGCDKCRGKGVSGRQAVVEVFRMTGEVEEAMSSRHPTIQHLAEIAKKQGMVSMRQDGVLKALAGILSMEEVLKETVEG